MNIFIMGAPGSGKGTFSSRLRDEYNLNHISTGDIFRENISKQTDLGKQAQKYSNQGLLVPDEITNAMVFDYLGNLEKKDGYLLDGYPRTLAQAQAFEEWSKGQEGQDVDVILSMDVPEDILTKRIVGRRTCKKCGEIYNIYFKPPKEEEICDNCGEPLSHRADDNEESLKVRLSEYDNNTAPVINYYEKEGKVKHIDANRDMEEIWESIVEALK